MHWFVEKRTIFEGKRRIEREREIGYVGTEMGEKIEREREQTVSFETYNRT